MIAIGVIYGALTGNIEAVANGALESAGEAVEVGNYWVFYTYGAGAELVWLYIWGGRIS